MTDFVAGMTVRLANGAIGVIKAVWSPENGMRKAGTLLLVKVGSKSFTVYPSMVTPVVEATTDSLGWVWRMIFKVFTRFIACKAVEVMSRLYQQYSNATDSAPDV
ncbi:unnamed protein product [Parajaminaea phylloscopi]